MKHEDVFSISGRGTVATGCVRNIASFLFYSLIMIFQVERGIANKGIDLEIIGFGSTKKTTLTGIGEIFQKGLLNSLTMLQRCSTKNSTGYVLKVRHLITQFNHFSG